MRKLTLEQVKDIIYKRPDELSKDELAFLFYIWGFQIKEYYSGKNNISFEIHFERLFIVRVHYPREKGIMHFENEFVNFGEETAGMAMARAKDTGTLILWFVNMFYNNLLLQAQYEVTYDEDDSLFESQTEATEYLDFTKELISIKQS